MRRAAVSAARGTDREMARFLSFAIGSLPEFDSQLELPAHLELVSSQAEPVESGRSTQGEDQDSARPLHLVETEQISVPRTQYPDTPYALGRPSPQ